MRYAAMAVLIGLLCGTAQANPPRPGDSVFGLTKIYPIHLTISAKDYAAMEPPPPPPLFGPGAARPGGLGFDNPDAGAGNFGFEFKYVRATVQIQGQTCENIGLRYKGSGTYMVSQNRAKRSFKIDLDRHDAAQNFHGLKKLNLNSGVMDPTRAREALAYAVFRAAGVPAPRTAFAEVTLTVPGKFDREYLGIYTLVEQVDSAFLQAHFQSAKGLLLKPEGIRGVPYLGEDRAAYEKLYNPRSDGDDSAWKRLIAFTRLVNRADEETFRREIGAYLDVGGFLRFLAVNALLSSLDGFLGMGHNYYLYLSPQSGKFVFFPWDLDLAFGGFFLFGSPDQLAELSVDHPHLGDNRLIDRLLAIPEKRATYRAEVQRIVRDIFSAEKLGNETAAVEGQLKDFLVRDRKAATARKEGGFGFPGMDTMFNADPVSLQVFRQKRLASVAAQFAGKSRGYAPKMNFGPPGGGGPPAGFGPGALFARPLRERLDTNHDGKVSDEEFAEGMKRLFGEWDRDGNGALDEGEITAGLQRLLSLPPQPGGR